MRKYLLILIIFALFCGPLYGFSLQDWKNSLDMSIRSQAEQSFSDLFKKKVTIKEAGGIVVGQIVLKKVTIEDIGEVEKVVLTFNPVQYAISKGDIIPSLIKISVSNGKLSLSRNRAGRWNIDALLPKAKNSAPPPPFNGQIVLDNCEVDYHDQLGFNRNPEEFQTVARGVNGKIDLGNKARISFSVGANVPETVKAVGYVNSKNGYYELNVDAQKLPLLKWGSYTVPLPGLAPQGGQVDLALRITPPKTKGWAASLSGKAFFYNSSAKFNNYELTGVNGKLFLADESLAFQGISGRLNGLPATVSGRFTDFSRQKLDLTVTVKDGKLESLTGLFPELKELKGRFNARLFLSGTVAAPLLTGSLTVPNGRAYQQPFSGSAAIALADKVFRADLQNALYYRGQVSGSVIIILNGEPGLDLKLAINALDLSALSQKTPGIEGLASGQLELTGPFPRLKGNLAVKLNRGSVFGQPMESLKADVQIKDGDFILDRLAGEGEQASFTASGRVKELLFDLQAEADGLQLSGRGIFGPMKANLNHFKGRIGWKLTPAFLASPLRNMTAVGEARLSGGRIGDQRFDLAEGLIEIDHGKIKVENAVLQKGDSRLNIAGQTGIGTETNLAVWTNGSNLDDYRLLNYFLPEELKNPVGRFTASFEVFGYLPPETKITSIDSLQALNFNGRLALTDGKIARAPVSRGTAGLAWRNRAFYLADGRLEGPKLRLNLNIELVPGKNLKATIAGVTDLGLWREFTYRYGRLEGELGTTVKLEGHPDKPNVAATFWADQLEYNDLFLDRIEGSLYFSQNKLQTLAPIIFRRGRTALALKGSANLNFNQPSESDLDFDLETEKAEVATVYKLIEGIRSEAYRWGITAKKKAAPQIFSLTGLAYSAQKHQQGKTIWYSADPTKPNFLRGWETIRREFEKKAAITPTESLTGEADGRLSVQGKAGNPSGNLQVQVKKGGFSGFLFDSLFLSASLNNGRVAVDKAIMAKERGSLNAAGEFSLAGKLGLEVKAREMPLDILSVVFPGKNFKGSFILDSTIGGSLNAPIVALSAGGKDNSAAGARFDSWTAVINYNAGRLTIGRLQLQTDKDLSTVEGEVLFGAPTKINLRADLNGDGFGIINLFNDQVTWVQGKAGLTLRANGSLNQPRLNGTIFLEDAEVRLNSLASSLKSLNGQALIIDSLVSLEALTALWTGERTRNYLNPLGAAGYVDLAQALGDQPRVGLNLTISPTSIFAAFPNLYIGSLQIDRLTLHGPLAFDLSAGPTLSGKINIDNSVVTLSKSGGNSKQVPFQFDLEVNLNKNVYAVMGDIGTLDLSNIFMNLEIESRGLKITGDMRAPTLLGRVQVKRGTINLLSREFRLLTPDQQQKYFPYSEQSEENLAIFTGGKGTEGFLPQIAITSLVNVEDQEIGADGAPKKKKVAIVAKLNGLIGSQDKTRGLKVNLSGFVEDKSKTPSEMVPANYSESDLRVLLLPDFIRGLTGVKTGGEKGQDAVETNVVVADFVSSRIQTILFRGVEREVEQKLGLESLTLEYNLGPKVREAMGVKDPVGLQQEGTPAWSVGFVKGFFDRLFIDVRYAQIKEPTISGAAQNSFNYQLTFKINPIWAIIYYREPLNLNEPATGYQKITLKAGFYFW
ncbi:MAG: DUF748 domain-containing protein [Candidatus Margulisiibacteriota bacterium]|jgi:hypothetical protein